MNAYSYCYLCYLLFVVWIGLKSGKREQNNKIVMTFTLEFRKSYCWKPLTCSLIHYIINVTVCYTLLKIKVPKWRFSQQYHRRTLYTYFLGVYIREERAKTDTFDLSIQVWSNRSYWEKKQFWIRFQTRCESSLDQVCKHQISCVFCCSHYKKNKTDLNTDSPKNPSNRSELFRDLILDHWTTSLLNHANIWSHSMHQNTSPLRVNHWTDRMIMKMKNEKTRLWSPSQNAF